MARRVGRGPLTQGSGEGFSKEKTNKWKQKNQKKLTRLKGNSWDRKGDGKFRQGEECVGGFCDRSLAHVKNYK